MSSFNILKSKWMNKYFVISISIIILAFYLLPLMIIDTGSAMFVLLLLLPAICFLTSVFYSFFLGIQWFYPIFIGALFAPTIWIYYNSSAWGYIIIYAIISLIGNLIGYLIQKLAFKYKKQN